MPFYLIFTWVIFIGLCGVCLVGLVNIVRVARLGGPQRMRNLLMATLAVGTLTFAVGFSLFSPSHSLKISRIIMQVSMALSVIVQLIQLRQVKDEPVTKA